VAPETRIHERRRPGGFRPAGAYDRSGDGGRVGVQTPVTATPKSVCEAILNFYGALHPRKTLAQLVADVRMSLHEHCTKVLILDDVSRLRLHREADRDALDLLRSLMSMHVTLILIGVEARHSELLTSGRIGSQRSSESPTAVSDAAATQTARRFDLIELGPFRYDTPHDITTWITHLTGIEDQIRLLRAVPGMLADGAMPEYLFRRTAGVIGSTPGGQSSLVHDAAGPARGR
jgi:hypothetical protein